MNVIWSIVLNIWTYFKLNDQWKVFQEHLDDLTIMTLIKVGTIGMFFAVSRNLDLVLLRNKVPHFAKL